MTHKTNKIENILIFNLLSDDEKDEDAKQKMTLDTISEETINSKLQKSSDDDNKKYESEGIDRNEQELQEKQEEPELREKQETQDKDEELEKEVNGEENDKDNESDSDSSDEGVLDTHIKVIFHHHTPH